MEQEDFYYINTEVSSPKRQEVDFLSGTGV